MVSDNARNAHDAHTAVTANSNKLLSNLYCIAPVHNAQRGFLRIGVPRNSASYSALLGFGLEAELCQRQGHHRPHRLQRR